MARFSDARSLTIRPLFRLEALEPRNLLSAAYSVQQAGTGDAIDINNSGQVLEEFSQLADSFDPSAVAQFAKDFDLDMPSIPPNRTSLGIDGLSLSLLDSQGDRVATFAPTEPNDLIDISYAAVNASGTIVEQFDQWI